MHCFLNRLYQLCQSFANERVDDLWTVNVIPLTPSSLEKQMMARLSQFSRTSNTLYMYIIDDKSTFKDNINLCYIDFYVNGKSIIFCNIRMI